MDTWPLPTILSGNKTVENNELPLVNQIHEADPTGSTSVWRLACQIAGLRQTEPNCPTMETLVRGWTLLRLGRMTSC